MTHPFGAKDLLETEGIHRILPAQYVRHAFDLIDEIVLLLVSGNEDNARSDKRIANIFDISVSMRIIKSELTSVSS